jgi:hypothetical protein
MANNKDTSAETWELERGSYPWGEWWKGTKKQIQAAGIGIGVAFPGDAGAPKTLVHTVDIRGVKVDIKAKERDLPVGVYRVTCPYVYREGNWRDGPYEKSQFAPGVQVVPRWYGVDEYVGTGPAMVACGLIRLDQLPGQPGRGSMRCTYGPDGAPRTRGQSSPSPAGTKAITRRGASSFVLEIQVSDEEDSRRRKVNEIAESLTKLEDKEGKLERDALNVTLDLLRRAGGPMVRLRSFA